MLFYISQGEYDMKLWAGRFSKEIDKKRMTLIHQFHSIAECIKRI